MEYPILNAAHIYDNNDSHGKGRFTLPDQSIFSLPEKVLQFGTGVLLRGLPDYFIDKANKKGIFNGRIVVVKSTSSGGEEFEKQDNLYIQNIRGIEKGKNVNNYILNASISRVLNANSQWNTILECAGNKDLSIIISNTTEVGISLVRESISEKPPVSYPAKLTAFLYERFKKFKGDIQTGFVIIPTELIVDNGKKLKEIVFEIAEFNKLEPSFLEWLERANTFCNSLVDRIVPGTPTVDLKDYIFSELGFQDNLLIVSEPYNLWAIEGDATVKDKLTFHKAGKGVVIEKNITPYRRRKLRILNGTHTILVGLGYLSGLDTVEDCMNDSLMKEFIQNIMMDEIVPALEVEREVSEAFAKEVLDRFANPSIHHPLINISLQYTSKMNMRNASTIINYYKKFDEVPKHFSLGIAAYLLFMKSVKHEDGKYYGERNGSTYIINDDNAKFFYDKWTKADVTTHHSCKSFVEEILENELWNSELKAVTGLSDHVATFLFELVTKGVVETLEEFVEFGEIEE